jgi:nucleotide-binding universal stress UspA family protein
MSAQPRRIVVAFDGSEPSIRALDAAAQLVGYGSTLTVVSVEPRDGALGDARDRLLHRHVTAQYLTRSGDPGTEIVEAARDLDADLIVVGRRTPPANESLSAQVVATAASDVLVVA